MSTVDSSSVLSYSDANLSDTFVQFIILPTPLYTKRVVHLGCETARVGPGRTGRVPAKTGRVRVGVFELEPDPFLEGLTQP
jgi:hypothetical protein